MKMHPRNLLVMRTRIMRKSYAKLADLLRIP